MTRRGGAGGGGKAAPATATAAVGALLSPLARPQFLQDVGVAVIIYLIGYIAMGGFSRRLEPKRKAWLLSVLCSLGMSLGSLPYVYQLAMEHGFVTAGMVYADDRLSVFVMAYFMTFLVLDIVIGVQHYPKEIGFLTGWFHHTLYMGMCVWAVVNEISISAVATMIMEIPTFVMALGRVYKSMRSDAIFGGTFFVTRICYLGYYIYCLMCDANPRITVWPVCVPAMVLHIFWFYGFVQQQRRLKSPRSATGAAGSEKATKAA